MKKKVSRLKTNRQAEAFLAQDLSGLDFSQFKPEPARFEFEKKDDQINMRVPKPLLAAVKARAKARHSLYTLHSGNARTRHRCEVAPPPVLVSPPDVQGHRTGPLSPSDG
jgi:predicted DNA binding CopG/RHH family protein